MKTQAISNATDTVVMDDFKKSKFDDKKLLLNKKSHMLSRYQFDEQVKQICKDEEYDFDDEINKLKNYVNDFNWETYPAYERSRLESQWKIEDKKDELEEMIKEAKDEDSFTDWDDIKKSKEEIKELTQSYKRNYKELGDSLEYFTQDEWDFFIEHAIDAYAPAAVDNGISITYYDEDDPTIGAINNDVCKRYDFDDDEEYEIIELFMKMSSDDRIKLIKEH
ncbi:hypothetical protein [Limosilactobacillus reuteri]|uniref:hypothetical protein n=1 Tax=Limosilactobacillus reuteri TaxID=1598 RepID=UPI003D97E3CE